MTQGAVIGQLLIIMCKNDYATKIDIFPPVFVRYRYLFPPVWEPQSLNNLL